MAPARSPWWTPRAMRCVSPVHWGGRVRRAFGGAGFPAQRRHGRLRATAGAGWPARGQPGRARQAARQFHDARLRPGSEGRPGGGVGQRRWCPDSGLCRARGGRPGRLGVAPCQGHRAPACRWDSRVGRRWRRAISWDRWRRGAIRWRCGRCGPTAPSSWCSRCWREPADKRRRGGRWQAIEAVVSHPPAACRRPDRAAAFGCFGRRWRRVPVPARRTRGRRHPRPVCPR